MKHAAALVMLGAVASGAAFARPVRQPATVAPADTRCGVLEGRAGPAVTWHPGRRQVVLFGGSGDTHNPFPRSLWAWDGAAWNCVAADGPPGRNTADLAFDPHRKVLVLHGGRDRDDQGRSRILNDTWEWNETTWTKVADEGLPSRIHFVLAYDAARRAVLLFGGIGSNGQWYRDTWAWNGARWSPTSIAPLPEGIIGRALIAEGRIVLMIARPDAGGCGSLHRPTLFELRGDTWAPISEPGPCFGPSSPAPIAWTPMGVLLYSGWNGPDATAPIVSAIWTRGVWRPIDGAPGRRRGGNSAYDAARQRVVHVGGENETGPIDETWEFDGARWTRVTGSTARRPPTSPP